MATYVILGNFTDQGIRTIKDLPKRVEAFREMAQKSGITVKDMYWTLGSYDVIAIVEFADEIALTALGLSIGAQGNVRTQTLRAFAAADVKSILGKVV